MAKLTIFKIAAWWAGLYHLGLGLIGVFGNPETVSAVIKSFFRANVEMTPQVSYLIKFCSAYMAAFGVAVILLALKPLKYPRLVWVPITLFTLRIFETLVFSDLLTNSFGIPPREEFIIVCIMTLILSLLFFFRPRAEYSPSSS
jgi:hypothetical protein